MGKRILIGSCGGLTGCYLARQFKKIPGCTVIGADTNAQNVTRHFLDEFIHLPGASSPNFRNCLAAALNQYTINYYIPTHSHEMKTVAMHEEWFRSMWNGNFLVSPYDTYLKLDNKRTANRALSDTGIPVPHLIDSPSPDVIYPIFMKANVGSGSSRAQIIESPLLHSEYARILPNFSFYEFIHGTEYTVDCMFNDSGKLLAYNQRIRLKSMGGAVIITQNNYDFDILPYLKKIESTFLIKGCVNFQYILSDNTPFFIDINLRYASGGLPLTVASGIDIPHILLDILDGKSPSYMGSCEADRKTMYRYFDEWYDIL